MAGSIAAWIIGAPFVAIVILSSLGRRGSSVMGGGTKSYTSGEGLPRRSIQGSMGLRTILRT